MALKPVFKVTIDDTEIADFQKRFAALQQQFRTMTATGGRQDAAFQDKFVQAVKSTIVPLAAVAKGTEAVYGAISKSTKLLERWGGILAGVAGLLTTGGALGFDRLGAAAGAQRRAASGLGTTPGGLSAFDINYRRFVDPRAVLSNVANARSSLVDRSAFTMLGIRDVDRRDTADLAAEVTEKATRKFIEIGQSAEMAHAFGLDKFFTIDELRRLASASPEERATQRARYGRDRGALDLPDDVLRKWQDFNDTVTRADAKLENVFVRGLVNLAGPLAQIYDSFINVVSALSESPKVKEWLTYFGQELQHLADWIGGEKFDEDVTSFVEGIKRMAESLEAFVKWIGGKLGWVGGWGSKPGVYPGDRDYDPSADPHRPSAFQEMMGLSGGFPDYPDRPGLIPVPEGVRGYPDRPGRAASAPSNDNAHSWYGPGAPENAFAIAASHAGEGARDVQPFLRAQGVDLDAASSAWCAAFVNASLAKAGVKGDGSMVATDFAKWGIHVDAGDLKAGDVLVQSRNHRTGETGGHVGFATGRTKVVGGRLMAEMLAGNEDGRVAYSWVPADSVEGRRATSSGRATDRSAFGGIEQQASLPPGLLWGVYGAESSFGTDLRTSARGARGPFQFAPETGAAYGLKSDADFYDTRKSGWAAGRYLQDLLQKYGGDQEKALAAYDWGPGNLDEDVRQHGFEWKRYAPQETQDYIGRVARYQLGQQSSNVRSGVEVNIFNNTGGSAVVATRSLAVG